MLQAPAAPTRLDAVHAAGFIQIVSPHTGCYKPLCRAGALEGSNPGRRGSGVHDPGLRPRGLGPQGLQGGASDAHQGRGLLLVDRLLADPLDVEDLRVGRGPGPDL